MKNFNNFTNLMNGVLKKGPSGEVKRTRLEEGSNEHPMSIHSASIEHPLGSGGNQVETSIKPCIWKYAAMMALLLTLACGQAWGANSSLYAGDRLYFDCTNWLAASAKIKVNLYGTDGKYSTYVWAQQWSGNIYYIDLEGTYNGFQVCRINPSDLSEEWNYTATKWADQRSDNDQNLLTLGSCSNNQTMTWGTRSYTLTIKKYIYFVNTQNWSQPHVRIGKNSYTDGFNMTRTAGTKNFWSYRKTDSNWAGYHAFAITDGLGWTNANNVFTSEGINNRTIYWYEDVSANITIVAGSKGGTVTNPSPSVDWYSATKSSGQLTYTVSWSTTNGTISVVKYNNDAGSSTTSVSSGGTVLPTQYIKITSTPSAGYYQNGPLTVTNATRVSEGVYYVTGNCTISATYTAVPTVGQIYQFVVNTGSPRTSTKENIETGDYPLNTGNYLSTLMGGGLEIHNDNNYAKISNAGIYLNDNSKAYLTLKLGRAIAVGDVLKWTNSGDMYINTTATKPGTATAYNKLAGGTNKELKIVTGSPLIGQSTVYIFRNSSQSISAFEINRPYTITLNPEGGSVSPTSVLGFSGDKVILVHAFKASKRFKGWYTAAEGGTKRNNYYTVAGAETVHAQWEAIPTSGDLFTLTMESTMAPASNTTVPAGDTIDLLQYATVYGGAAVLKNTDSSAKGQIAKSTSKVTFNAAKLGLYIDLDFTILEGDTIITTIESQNLSYTATSARTTTNNFTSGTNVKTVVGSSNVLKNSSHLYLWTASTSGGVLSSLKIKRPAKYTVSYNSGGGSGSMSSHSVVKGADQALTANTFTKNGYTFSCWHANVAVKVGGETIAAGGDIADGATLQALSGDVTLTAQWTCTTPTFGTNLSTIQVDYDKDESADALTVAATANSGTVTYQWYSNDGNDYTSPTELDGETDASYTPATASAGTTYYFCVATNTTGSCTTTANSNIAKIVVTACTAPTIGSQPSNVSICPGSTTTLTVGSITGGNAPYTYQWYDASNDAAMSTGSGYTSASFTTPTLNAAASYYCIVTENGGCTTQSSTAAVSMKTTTAISSQPTSVANANVKSSTSLSVTATGTNLSYQWYTCDDDQKTNADDLDGETDATLSITPDEVGVTYYYCVVTGDCGTETSNVVSITAKNAISPTLSYSSSVGVGNTLSPTLSGNTGSGTVTWVSSNDAIATVASDGTVTGVATGSVTITATIAATDSYWGNTATSGTITITDYTITYNCDGAESGCPSNVSHATALPNPLPSAPYKAGYTFDGWYTNSGKTTSAVAGASILANTTMYAKWTTVYASGSYSFDGNTTVGTDPSKTVTTSDAEYSAFRVDNIFFSDTKIQFEGTDGTPSGDKDDYKGWKIKAASSTIKFFVEGNSDVVVSIGSIGSSSSCKISYTDQSSVAQDNISIAAGTALTYKVKAGTMVTITMVADVNNKKSVTLKRIAISTTATCTTSPTVTAGSNSSVEATTATVSCSSGISSLGSAGCSISSYGFVLNTTGTPTLSDTQHEVGTSYASTGVSFSKNLTSLTAGTTYYVRPYATNGNGTSYGTQTSFTTKYVITTGSHTNGSVTIPSAAASGATVNISATPNTGYSFTSWTITKTTGGDDVTSTLLGGNSTTASTSFTMPSYAVTVVATFTINSHTLTWDFDGGETSATEGTNYTAGGSVNYNTSLTYPADNTMSKSGYDFAGWDSKPSNMPDNDLTITATWATKYTVTFDPMTGGSVDPTSAQGSSVTKVTLPTPTHDDYTFDGWYLADTKIGDAGDKINPTGNVTLYAKWKGSCAGSGSGISVRFTSSNKNDAGNAFADMSTSSNTTQMVGSGTAKLIAINSAGLYATTNKDGYRSDSRMEMVFYFSSTSTLDVYVGVNSTGREYGLYSFSPADDDHDELSEIVTSDYATCSIVTSNVSVAGAAFANTGTGTPSLSSGITSFTKIGGAKISYTSLSGFYVFKANGTSDAYVYGFDINGGSGACYTVTYNGNGATSGYTNDPVQYAKDADPVVLDCGYEKTGYAFIGWAEGTTHRDAGTVDYQPGDIIEDISSDVTLYAIWKQIKYFTGAASSTSWNASGNWSPSGAPTLTDPVVIQANTEVDIVDAKALRVDIETGNTLTINAGKALIIAETLTKAGGATAASDVIINSTRAAGGGALIIGGETGTNAATMNFETKAKLYNGSTVNQFIGSPFSNTAPYVDYGQQLYKFCPKQNGDRGWWQSHESETAMTPFWGYNVLCPETSFLDLNWTGNLNASESKTITDFYYNGSSETDNMFANSWTAPIHVGAIESTDLVKASATFYMFNAGTPAQEAGHSDADAANNSTAPGTYISIPIHSATYAGIGVIPSMQAFYVLATGSGASLTLDYNKIVYTPALTSVGITPNRAPRRSVEVDEPEVIKLRVQSETGWAANTYVLGRADFAEGYEDGWDGAYIEGESATPKLYTPSVDGNMFVNCLPQIDGTVVGFRKGSADSQYTFTFGYEGDEEYYLKDLKLDTETRIDGEHSYAFTAEAEDNASRFIIIRKTPTIATGVEDVENGTVIVRKLIIDDKVYIIRGGMMYDVTGKMIK